MKQTIEKIKALNAVKVKFAITDIDGVLRGKYINTNKLLKGLEEGFGFCNVVFGWDSSDVCYENTQVSGWNTGYPDAMASIDLTTFRQIPWEHNIPFFLADFSKDNSDIQKVCPRTLLKSIRQECLDLGFKPLFANEFEWFNFYETSNSFAQKQFQDPTPITSGMFGYSLLRIAQNVPYFNDLFDLLLQFNIPLEGLHTETGNGVYEAAIEYSDILEAADRSVLFKTTVKEIAYKHNIMASFMAKWNAQLPGCSGHIHQSLWNETQSKNLFYDDACKNNISSIMESYIAGQLYCLPYILPLYAPTINSYKRFVSGSWASISQSWGIENRTTALRVIPHSSKSMRLETRVSGADCNAYLAMSAALASGLYGIKKGLKLQTLPTLGNEYSSKVNSRLPKTLFEAIQNMKASDIPNLLFGEVFTDHFIKTREWEHEQFMTSVTNWELKRYFEII
ncbi:MAG: hypothetical protein RLZZ479_1305 [Bacteroidota bacterium]|jgi:glutamine synthetase